MLVAVHPRPKPILTLGYFDGLANDRKARDIPTTCGAGTREDSTLFARDVGTSSTSELARLAKRIFYGWSSVSGTLGMDKGE
jgi:hypothetical protein